MRCVVGIDLGSTTTKAVLLDEEGHVVGRGVTNSRSNYEAASAVARQEALTDARFTILRRGLEVNAAGVELIACFEQLFRVELQRMELQALRKRIEQSAEGSAASGILDRIDARAEEVFAGAERKSDFFRDLAGAAFMSEAEIEARERGAPFERLMSLYDRSILDVEAEYRARDFPRLFTRSAEATIERLGAPRDRAGALREAAYSAARIPIEERAFCGTGYGRQTLPFPPEAVRSEILCHGRGAHRNAPGTRTVLDIGGQDTKAIQVDGRGTVTSFQMNDRCAAGCGRYLGYVADELSLGLHELGPLALKAARTAKVNSTCTVFAGAELRERLALGERREDILAGLHRAIMLRAMSLIARSGGVKNEMTFTGGVAKNPMAVKLLQELVADGYGGEIAINVHPDSIFAGALGAALYALDDARSGKPSILPAFARAEQEVHP